VRIARTLYLAHVDYFVRRATVDDAAGIAVAHVASWKAAYRGLLPDQLLDNLSVTHGQERMSNDLATPAPRSDVFVATRHHAVAGFAWIGPRRCAAPAEHDGELYSIYLHPDHWGHGIGQRLHSTALARLHELGFTAATLWVLNGNERAINFYHRTGWRENGVSRVDTRPDGTELPEIQFHRVVVQP
jgi:ribosomal protein S18 acetylase RimI-like enzyme